MSRVPVIDTPYKSSDTFQQKFSDYRLKHSISFKLLDKAIEES